MEIYIIGVFIVGYIFIALEHVLKIDKASSALITGAVCWAIIAFSGYDLHELKHELAEHIAEISEILFFLLGAMTIVELVDSHQGFKIITDRITTKNKIKLLWTLCFVAFFFSAVLDNLTAAIVMSALLMKILKDKKDLWFFGGMIIIAANAGGAWSPIGDVTTIMLWIDDKVTALNIIQSTIIPSLVCVLVPLIYVSFTTRGNISLIKEKSEIEHKKDPTTSFERNLVFSLGVLGLLFVPIFKLVTHLPPYMGMLLSLGIIWLVTEILHGSKNHEEKTALTVSGVVRKIDVPTIFFFLGILLAVSSLQTIGTLDSIASSLRTMFNGDIFIINIIIGALSSIVDNVPLVAGAIDMYPNEITDSSFWEFLAYCAGTGGSLLIIGSAAGVAMMGILKIDFFWYLRKITFLALIGYVSGALCYWVFNKDKNDIKLKDVAEVHEKSHAQNIDFDVSYIK